MSNLSFIERSKLEKLLGMSSGYVLDFSNRTFQEFVADSVGQDIFDAKYDYGSGSKANRLRAFWKLEPNPVVGKLLTDLAAYYRETAADEAADNTSLNDCEKIASRLLDGQCMPD